MEGFPMILRVARGIIVWEISMSKKLKLNVLFTIPLAFI
jgi:hypothetical protein